MPPATDAPTVEMSAAPPTVSEVIRTHRWKLSGGVAVCLLIVIFVGASSLKGRAAKDEAPSDASEIPTLVSEVRALVQIADEDAPAVATVTDVELLRAQSPLFYRDAQNGDRLLVWKDKIVLYSAAQGRVIAAQPIELPSAEEAAPQKETPTIVVRNASGRAGLAANVTDRLSADGYRVSDPGNAAASYPRSVIVVAEGKSFPQTVNALLAVIGGEVQALPAGEPPFSEDILVILGADARE